MIERYETVGQGRNSMQIAVGTCDNCGRENESLTEADGCPHTFCAFCLLGALLMGGHKKE